MPDGDRQFYGRRRGKRLRRHRAELMQDLLPQLALPVALQAAPGQPVQDLDPRNWFDPPVAEVWLEIGFGGGEHLAAQAAAHPEIGFIGAEPYVNGVASLLALAEREGLRNLRILSDDVRLLLPRLRPGSIGRCFILFPDPWPKLRHHRRRIVNDQVLDWLAAAMPPGAELRLATDHMGYARWMLVHLMRHPGFVWAARRPADWRERPADWPPTRYEAKARAAGAAPVFLRFLRRPAA